MGRTGRAGVGERRGSGAAGLADDEARGERGGLGGRVGEDRLDGAGAHLVDRHVDRGERGRDVLGDRDVVEARQREVAGHVQARLADRTEGADGHRVVGREDGRWPVGEGQQRRGGGVARLLGEVAADHERGVGVEAALGDRAAVARQPRLRVRVDGGAADEGDPAMPEAGKVADHRGSALLVVDRHGRVARERAAEEHHREVGRKVGPQHVGLDVGRHHHEPIDAADERPERGDQLVGAVVDRRQERVVAMGADGALDAADDLRVELTVEVRQQHPDGLGGAGGQAPRGAVGDVAEVPGRLHETAARALPHRAARVEHARHGRDRDPRLPSNVAHGDRHDGSATESSEKK